MYRAEGDACLAFCTGLKMMPAWLWQTPKGLKIPGEGIVRGDGKNCNIAAASIIAKVSYSLISRRVRAMQYRHGSYSWMSRAVSILHAAQGSDVHPSLPATGCNDGSPAVCDRIMIAHDEAYPQYKFAQHYGYLTEVNKYPLPNYPVQNYPLHNYTLTPVHTRSILRNSVCCTSRGH